MLATANLRLHKIASSHPEVTQAFPDEDQATDIRNLDFSKDSIPVQRSLGVFWDLKSDAFTLKVSSENKPFSRRGVLSTINSLYDPLGLAAPVTIRGKFLLRSMSADLCNVQPGDWDAPLPEERRPAWELWRQSLLALDQIRVPRAYSSKPLNAANRVELHTFCDASNEAIGAVSYLKSVQDDGHIQVSFVLGKAKLASTHATTTPRLELCAAVLGVEVAELVIEELDLEPQAIVYYSDSRIVLGYIGNETRRFYVYVSNRVQRIRRSTLPNQWHYVPSHLNLTDLATRSVDAQSLSESIWHTGPAFLHNKHVAADMPVSSLASETKLDDPEVRPEVKVLTNRLEPNKCLGSARFSRFSQWFTLLKAIARLIILARSRKKQAPVEEGDHAAPRTVLTVQTFKQAQSIIIKNMQLEAYGEDLKLLQNSERLPATSPLKKLSPIIDAEGLLRVGGRLEHADLKFEERHPLILPSSHHATTLIVRYYHARVQHQGRHFTLGAIRSHGLWILGGKRLINSVINSCIKCKKLRGRQQIQKMADLPVDRLTPAPSFSFVGLDVFGPWLVSARRTRGGVANSKRWAVLFTCLTTRAIHIELIESMDSSSFINALRRFLALRGPVVQLRSDCGTNFVGAHNELQASLNEMDDAIQSYLASEGCDWIFNAPHSSHVGGVWERMIGVTRRILDAMLAEIEPKRLSHEVLLTLMAEVTAIVNASPLVPVPTDPEAPEVLTPAILLTQKTQSLKATPGNFSCADLHSKQWRQVQHLANVFWHRWRKEFLPTLQPRRKWEHDTKNLEEGDLVLLRCKDLPRNSWPLARITKTFPSVDGKVRKIELLTAKDGSGKSYTRPVTEVILLRSEDNLKKMRTTVG